MAAPTGQEGESRLGLLRVLTCGSVDDGKSTLLGRLLFDTGQVLSDHLAALAETSAAASDVDLSLLFDGLEAEREQGITIDVTYRAFSSARRAFRLLDAPGHEQYTRNMATAASGADLAILLVDARVGIKPQTRRHASICRLFGVRHLVLAVNKMDLVGFDQSRFDAIAAEFSRLTLAADFESVVSIPLSALRGDNVATRSAQTHWYGGPALLEYLESVDVEGSAAERPLRLPVQLVLREPDGGRRYLGTVASGQLRRGDALVAMPSGRPVSVAAISGVAGEQDRAGVNEAVSVALAQDVDLSRGDVLADPRDAPTVSSAFAAQVLWLSEDELLPGRSYILRVGTTSVPATVTTIRHKLDIETLGHAAARTLAQNEIGLCHIALPSPVAFDTFAQEHRTGSFVLIDRGDFRTVAAGTIEHDLRRATNVRPQALTIGKADRAAQKGQRPVVLWFTGLSGAGKSTVADLVERKLNVLGCHTMLLDGDNVRQGLGQDLGFTPADRVENIRRAGEVAKLMVEAGLIVLCSFISPYRAERRLARDILENGEFIEVFVDTPVEECIRRDPKGLYAKALAGKIPNFTGIHQAYEPPHAPELHLRTAEGGPETLADRVVAELHRRGNISIPGSRDPD
jgi:bifunctional enzyme CysN/CysC